MFTIPLVCETTLLTLAEIEYQMEKYLGYVNDDGDKVDDDDAYVGKYTCYWLRLLLHQPIASALLHQKKLILFCSYFIIL
ncbi:hypothetical protein M6B38_335475 [Iris pallida]|uniref:Uncharacterized protein n=1 Tax=Iris pallida TaxID=29817 RepID=A0AAX6H057_IRIPA|nr:hypothetical protein M6B38_335475 [Iris pallida]